MTKRASLEAELRRMKSVLVAFSGGVDSSLLLAVAHEILGENVLAVTAVSPVHPSRERDEASAFAKEKRIPHELLFTHEIELPSFVKNSPDRCYHCKKALCVKLNEIAEEQGFEHVLHGANADDLGDFRPGFQAAIEEGIKAPLLDVGLGKAEIRALAKEMGLPQWNRPSMACLASRIPYGSEITEKKLGMIENAEAYLWDKGLRTFRVRHHGDLARIEVGVKERALFMDDASREGIVQRFRDIGFNHIALDLEAFESGKMNRGLSLQEEKTNYIT